MYETKQLTLAALPHTIYECQRMLDSTRNSQLALSTLAAERKAEIEGEVASDPIYTNERQRKATITFKLANDDTYQNHQRDEHDARVTIEKLEAEMRFLRDLFRVRQNEYQRETLDGFAAAVGTHLQRLANHL